MNSTRFQVCRVCKDNEARYTCRRCNVVYCSVRCFQGHSSECFDAFARAHISAEKDASATLPGPAPPAAPPAPRHALAEDTAA